MLKKFHLWTVLALIIAGAVASCVSTRRQPSAATDTHPVWPPPPSEPRVVFVKTISGPADIGERPSMLRRVSNWITGENGESSKLQKPFGLAVDEIGNLCLTDMGAGAVCYCDFNRKRWKTWKSVGKLHFQSPVAVARKKGIFYVADSELCKVIAFGDDGKEKMEIANPLQRPVGLAIAGDSVAIADSQAHAVFVFGLAGEFRFKFGSRGTGSGEFNFPTHVGVDNKGHWLVTDSLNSRIQVFTADGKFISQIGSGGDTSGHFGRPKGVASDAFGRIYVADAVFDNIQIFDVSGRLLLNLGQSGTRPGEFALPNGVAVGPGNRIYVTDCYNRRVQVLESLVEE